MKALQCFFPFGRSWDTDVPAFLALLVGPQNMIHAKDLGYRAVHQQEMVLTTTSLDLAGPHA